MSKLAPARTSISTTLSWPLKAACISAAFPFYDTNIDVGTMYGHDMSTTSTGH